MTATLLVSVLVFVLSPKTIGMAFDAENLDVQTPGLWIMASSAGVFCAVAVLACWLAVLRRGALAPDEPMAEASAGSLMETPASTAAEPAVSTPAAAPASSPLLGWSDGIHPR
jgi:alpha-1,2-mannosyltransferase